MKFKTVLFMMAWHGNGTGKLGDFMYMHVYMTCAFKGSVFNTLCINLKMQVFLCMYFVMSGDLLQLNVLVFCLH